MVVIQALRHQILHLRMTTEMTPGCILLELVTVPVCDVQYPQGETDTHYCVLSTPRVLDPRPNHKSTYVQIDLRSQMNSDTKPRRQKLTCLNFPATGWMPLYNVVAVFLLGKRLEWGQKAYLRSGFFWPPSGFAWTGVEWSVEGFFTLLFTASLEPLSRPPCFFGFRCGLLVR